MPKSYQVTACFLSLLVTACESDSDKLTRLNFDKAVACTMAQKYQREYEAVMRQSKSHLQDSLTLAYVDYNTKCELATRDLNRFMRE